MYKCNLVLVCLLSIRLRVLDIEEWMASDKVCMPDGPSELPSKGESELGKLRDLSSCVSAADVQTSSRNSQRTSRLP